MFQVRPGDQIFEDIQRVQHDIQRMEYPIDGAEQEAQLTYRFGAERAPDEEVADLNRQLDELTHQVTELRAVADEVNAKALPVVQNA